MEQAVPPTMVLARLLVGPVPKIVRWLDGPSVIDREEVEICDARTGREVVMVPRVVDW